MTHIATLLTSIALLAACACGPRKIPLESDVPFAMHQETREFVVDRSPAGGPATVTPASWVRLPGGPAWVLRRGTETRAAYWSDGNAGVTAREGLDPSSALHATVRPRWDEGDVRLRVEPAGGPAFDSDVFARLDGGGGTAALSRSAKTILDVRGRYQAALRDAAGAEVGSACASARTSRPPGSTTGKRRPVVGAREARRAGSDTHPGTAGFW